MFTPSIHYFSIKIACSLLECGSLRSILKTKRLFTLQIYQNKYKIKTVLKCADLFFYHSLPMDKCSAWIFFYFHFIFVFVKKNTIFMTIWGTLAALIIPFQNLSTMCTSSINALFLNSTHAYKIQANNIITYFPFEISWNMQLSELDRVMT